MTPKDRHEYLVKLATEAYDRVHDRPTPEVLATWDVFARSAHASRERDRDAFIAETSERMAQAATVWTSEADLGGVDNLTTRELEAELRKRGVGGFSASLGNDWVSLHTNGGARQYTARGTNLVEAITALLAKIDGAR